MSRAETPTDNPIIESLNGWIKKEINFNLKLVENIPLFIETMFIILITKDCHTN